MIFAAALNSDLQRFLWLKVGSTFTQLLPLVQTSSASLQMQVSFHTAYPAWISILLSF